MTRDVLVIDDSATVRKLVEISLRGRPLRPHFADSGSEGIRSATALAPAAILEELENAAADRRSVPAGVLVEIR